MRGAFAVVHVRTNNAAVGLGDATLGGLHFVFTNRTQGQAVALPVVSNSWSGNFVLRGSTGAMEIATGLVGSDNTLVHAFRTEFALARRLRGVSNAEKSSTARLNCAAKTIRNCGRFGGGIVALLAYGNLRTDAVLNCSSHC